MNILVACEYTGTVRDAFRKLGHHAQSCDIKPSEDRNWKIHLMCDVQDILYDGWDMMIAHPPCTHLCSSGARWWKDKKREQAGAISFVRMLMEAPIPKIAIENQVGILSRVIRKPDQIVHPWMFGDSYSKATCLWLKGLPKLTPTNIVDKGEFVIHGGKKIPKWYSNREIARDRTFPGMAKAMAEQWGGTKC